MSSLAFMLHHELPLLFDPRSRTIRHITPKSILAMTEPGRRRRRPALYVKTNQIPRPASVDTLFQFLHAL
jgi:hypothetical protein